MHGFCWTIHKCTLYKLGCYPIALISTYALRSFLQIRISKNTQDTFITVSLIFGGGSSFPSLHKFPSLLQIPGG